MNIAGLLRLERLGDGAFRERTSAALQPFLDAAQAARPGFGRQAFFDCVRSSLPAALDISLEEVVAGGWRAHRGTPTGLRIRSTHHSVVDVRAGERLLACINVQATVVIEVTQLAHRLAGNCVATAGEALAGGELRCAGALVLEEERRPVVIGRCIALTP